MTTGWIKITEEQRVAIRLLRATNETGDLLRPVADVDGGLWLSADCLDEVAGIFSHYAPVLSTLTVTQENEPLWPVEP